MSSGFYNVQNLPNFRIENPIVQMQEDISNLKIEVNTLIENQIHPQGHQVFLNFGEEQTWRTPQFFSQQPGLTGTLNLLSGLPMVEQTTKIFSLASEDNEVMIFATNPQLDMWGKSIVTGNWNTYLYTETSSTDMAVVVQHYGMFLYNGNYVLYQIDTQESQDTVHPILASTSERPVQENVIVNKIAFPSRNLYTTAQLLTVVLVVNLGVTTNSVSFKFGGEAEENTRARIETTWNSVHQPSSTTWVYGTYDNVVPYNATNFILPGSFRLPFSTEDVPMYTMFDTNIVFDSDSFYGSTLYYLLDNFSSAGIKIEDTHDPSSMLMGFPGEWGFIYSNPNPWTIYKGFNYITKTDFGDDPSINRLYIFSLTGALGGICNLVRTFNEYNTNDDFWTFETFDGEPPETFVYTVVFGRDITVPLTQNELDSYFRAYVDNVIYNVNGTQATALQMKQNFDMNFSKLKAALPPLYQNFEFLDWEERSTVGGSGGGLTVNLGAGRTYFQAGEYNGGPIFDGGSGYQVGDIVTVLGTDLGGSSPDNDAILTITSVDGSGTVLNYTISGNCNYLQGQIEISDGGSDQYDGGNEIYSYYDDSFMEYLPGVQSAFFSPDSEHTVDYNESIFCLNIRAFNSPYFYIDGNLGSDGDGNTEVKNIEQKFYILINGNDNWSAQGSLVPGRTYSITTQYNFGAITMSQNQNSSVVPSTSPYSTFSSSGKVSTSSICPRVSMRERYKLIDQRKYDPTENDRRLNMRATGQPMLDPKKELKKKIYTKAVLQGKRPGRDVKTPLTRTNVGPKFVPQTSSETPDKQPKVVLKSNLKNIIAKYKAYCRILRKSYQTKSN
jgi:hypothetical protein